MSVAVSGIFMLHEKYHTLNQVNFTQDDGEQIEGHLVAEKLKDKNSRLPLYPAFIIFTVTKNLKCLFANLDTVLIGSPPFTLTVFDKIYGQQSFIVSQKLIPVGNS
jgi:hypothetical protein